MVAGEDGRCKAYGMKGSLELKPGEAVVFKMNDVEGMYQDNKGEIDVKLSVVKE